MLIISENKNLDKPGLLLVKSSWRDSVLCSNGVV